jgi:hypothetical protein
MKRSMTMNTNPRTRNRAIATLAIAAALTGAIGSAAPAAAASEECIFYELPYEQGHPIVVDAGDPLCATNAAVEAAVAEATQWPDYDPSNMTIEIAVAEARREAEGWPDYDSTAISDSERNIAIDAATREAAAWPDYDSTAISDSERNIAIDAATREAAGWPNYDPTTQNPGVEIDVAAISPRMTHIAAEEASRDTAIASGNPFVL